MAEEQKVTLGTIKNEYIASFNVIDQNFLVTEDMLKASLYERRDILSGRGAWATPFGIFISTFAALITADFKSFLGLESVVYKVLFIVVTLVAVVWSGWSFFTRPSDQSISEFVQSMKEKSSKVINNGN